MAVATFFSVCVCVLLRIMSRHGAIKRLTLEMIAHLTEIAAKLQMIAKMSREYWRNLFYFMMAHECT